MLISFLALVALMDGILYGIHNGLAHFGFPWFPASLEIISGKLFAPVAWVIRIPWKDCTLVGNLLGTRMVLNRLVAFSMLGPEEAVLDPALVHDCYLRFVQFFANLSLRLAFRLAVLAR